jgi:hypothetical protein
MKEHILRVFKNRVVRRIFEPKRDEVTEERMKLHNTPPQILLGISNEGE